MALLNCPECEKEISDKAIACPHCGYPLSEKKPEKDVVVLQDATVVEAGGAGTNSAKVMIGIMVGMIVIVVAAVIYALSQSSLSEPAGKITTESSLASDNIEKLFGVPTPTTKSEIIEAIAPQSITICDLLEMLNQKLKTDKKGEFILNDAKINGGNLSAADSDIYYEFQKEYIEIILVEDKGTGKFAAAFFRSNINNDLTNSVLIYYMKLFLAVLEPLEFENVLNRLNKESGLSVKTESGIYWKVTQQTGLININPKRDMQSESEVIFESELSSALVASIESFSGYGKPEYGESWYPYIEHMWVYNEQGKHYVVLTVNAEPAGGDLILLLTRYYTDEELEKLIPILLDVGTAKDLDEIDLAVIGECLYKIKTQASGLSTYYSCLISYDIPVYDYLAEAGGWTVSNIRNAADSLGGDDIYAAATDYMANDFKGSFTSFSYLDAQRMAYAVLGNFKEVYLEKLEIYSNENGYITTYYNKRPRN